jgi:S1-C subfamily serine protease
MNPSNLLQHWSNARAALSAALAPRTVAIAAGRRRMLSGFRWRGEYAITVAEALDGSDSVLVMSDAGQQQAVVIACDLATDVAVLRLADASALTEPGDAACLQAGALETGAGVAFAGRSPRGPLIGFGTVRLSGPAWSSRRGGAIDLRLEFEGSVDARFEGAVVADLAAVPRAMLVAGPRGSLIGIPASTIERIVSTVERHGYLPRPYLGLRLQSLWLDDATRARWGRESRAITVVSGVEEGSAADSAGLFPGDLLEAIDGTAVDSIQSIAARLGQSSPGQRLELRFRRGGQPETVQIQVAEWRP